MFIGFDICIIGILGKFKRRRVNRLKWTEEEIKVRNWRPLVQLVLVLLQSEEMRQ